MVKNSPANAVDGRHTSSIPGSGKSPGGGLSSPLQYSCLGNPLDRGAWQATVHRVTKSQTQLKWPSTHNSTHWFFEACVRGSLWTPAHTPVEIERSLLWPLWSFTRIFFSPYCRRSWFYAYAKFPADFWEELVIAYAGGCVLDAVQFYAK